MVLRRRLVGSVVIGAAPAPRSAHPLPAASASAAASCASFFSASCAACSASCTHVLVRQLLAQLREPGLSRRGLPRRRQGGRSTCGTNAGRGNVHQLACAERLKTATLLWSQVAANVASCEETSVAGVLEQPAPTGRSRSVFRLPLLRSDPLSGALNLRSRLRRATHPERCRWQVPGALRRALQERTCGDSPFRAKVARG